MASFIYGLCRGFFEQHGYWPNVLLINASHLQALGNDLGSLENAHQLRRRLGLEVLVRKHALHPRVIWMQRGCAQPVERALAPSKQRPSDPSR